jgi:hypothetical protein
MSLTFTGRFTIPHRLKFLSVPHATPVPPKPLTVDQLFKRHLVTGNGTSQLIPSIDFTGDGGMLMVKARTAAYDPAFSNTIRGGNRQVVTDSTGAELTNAGVTAFTNTGFTLGSAAGYNQNGLPFLYLANKVAPGFFFMKQYTGNGAMQVINHGLGMAPGFFTIKRLDQASGWTTWHSATGGGNVFNLNTTNAVTSGGPTMFGNNSTIVAPNDTTITLGSAAAVNANGGTYMIYGWANNPTGHVVTGKATENASGVATITTPWTEGAQFLLIKKINQSASGNWNYVYPTTGKSLSDPNYYMLLNSTKVEAFCGYTQTNGVIKAAEGSAGQDVLYMAIRASTT